MPAIVLSDHAIERYRERVRPMLDLQATLEDLHQVLASGGQWSDEAPPWAAASGGDGFVLLGPDIVLPVHLAPDGSALVATTCLTRGGMDETRRAAKKLRKATAEARRREVRRLRSLPRTRRLAA